MSSAFREEFLTEALPEIEGLFGEPATYLPVDGCGIYKVTATFVLPEGDVLVDSPIDLHIKRMDVLIRTSALRQPPKIGDVITRIIDGQKQSFKVSEDNIEPHAQPDDPLSLQTRLHTVRVNFNEAT